MNVKMQAWSQPPSCPNVQQPPTRTLLWGPDGDRLHQEAGNQKQQQQQQQQPALARLRTTPAFAALASRLTSVADAATMLQRMLHLGDAASSDSSREGSDPGSCTLLTEPEDRDERGSCVSGASSLQSCADEIRGEDSSSGSQQGCQGSSPPASSGDVHGGGSQGSAPSSQQLPELSPSKSAVRLSCVCARPSLHCTATAL